MNGLRGNGLRGRRVIGICWTTTSEYSTSDLMCLIKCCSMCSDLCPSHCPHCTSHHRQVSLLCDFRFHPSISPISSTSHFLFVGLHHTWSPIPFKYLKTLFSLFWTLCLSASGELYSWGDNDSFVLGYQALPIHSQSAPRRVMFSVSTRITGVAAGSAHSLALTGPLSFQKTHLQAHSREHFQMTDLSSHGALAMHWDTFAVSRPRFCPSRLCHSRQGSLESRLGVFSSAITRELSHNQQPMEALTNVLILWVLDKGDLSVLPFLSLF